jgi:diaminohydroxyphosphoribosylaminopyrimidine deaminase / 5-amino-6-(5-phosphoribosylamino)uracil reductase
LHLQSYITSPNPSVVCVLQSTNGAYVFGQTQPRGWAHAEVIALRAARAAQLDLRSATAYVSLEPCAHQGHTPPCSSALIEAGVAKVVVSLLDPNPLVAGKGAQQLRDAGIEVEVLPANSPQAVASRELNMGFFSRMIRKTPWVRMKVAASLDGVTALPNGQSQWITGAAARADGQAWRARSCAVLTGMGTVLADDPLLNVRSLLSVAHADALLNALLPLPPEIKRDIQPSQERFQIPAPRQPHLVIVDSQLDLPLNAKLLQTLGQRGEPSSLYAQNTIDLIAPRDLLVYHFSQNDQKIKALEALGVKLIYMPESGSSKVDLAAMMRDLAVNQEINELHVEAGFKLNGSLLKAGLVDEMVMYQAPKLLGAGMGVANLSPLASLQDLPTSQDLVYQSVDLIGPQQENGQQDLSTDLRIVARVRGRDQF